MERTENSLYLNNSSLTFNYYLDGLHSYAAGDAFPVPSFVFPTFVTLIFISFIGFFRFKKWVN